MKTIRIATLCLTLLSLSLTACGAAPATPAAPTSNTSPAVVVAEGRLAPQATLDLSFSVGGEIAEVLVRDGEVVEAGQVLARLTLTTEMEAALARAEQDVLSAQQTLTDLNANADLALAQAQLAELTAQQEVVTAEQKVADLKEAQADKPDDEKPTDLDITQAEAQVTVAQVVLAHAQAALKTLTTAQGIDPDVLSAAEARQRTAQATLANVQAMLASLDLKAPQAGTVVNVRLAAHERIAPAQVALTLADLSQWVVTTDDLTELEVVNIALGQPVQIQLDALPAVTFTGEVQHINTQYEEKRGDVTYTATIRLTQTDPHMRWGMTAAMQFQP